MLSIRLNSHSLSDFQNCPKQFWYSSIESLRRKEKKKAFQKGSLMSRALELFYNKKQRTGTVPDDFIRRIFVKMQGPTITSPDKQLMATRFLLYASKFKSEAMHILGTELGFATLLYEDKNYQFIYEGTPDLVISDHRGLIVMDHKTRSREYNINELNNQAMGYIYGVGAHTFIYNYIGLQETGGMDKWFKREIIRFSPAQINRWREDTIFWFKQLAHCIEADRFPRTYQCTGQYGLCDYNSICRQPDSRSELIVINSDFQKVPRRNSW